MLTQQIWQSVKSTSHKDSFALIKRQNRFFLPLSIQRKTKEKNGITLILIHFSITHLAAHKGFVIYLLFL